MELENNVGKAKVPVTIKVIGELESIDPVMKYYIYVGNHGIIWSRLTSFVL